MTDSRSRSDSTEHKNLYRVLKKPLVMHHLEEFYVSQARMHREAQETCDILSSLLPILSTEEKAKLNHYISLYKNLITNPSPIPGPLDVEAFSELITTFCNQIKSEEFKKMQFSCMAIAGVLPYLQIFLNTLKKKYGEAVNSQLNTLTPLTITPIQRLPRIELLLKDILKHTNPNSLENQLKDVSIPPHRWRNY